MTKSRSAAFGAASRALCRTAVLGRLAGSRTGLRVVRSRAQAVEHRPAARSAVGAAIALSTSGGEGRARPMRSRAVSARVGHVANGVRATRPGTSYACSASLANASMSLSVRTLRSLSPWASRSSFDPLRFVCSGALRRYRCIRRSRVSVLPQTPAPTGGYRPSRCADVYSSQSVSGATICTSVLCALVGVEISGAGRHSPARWASGLQQSRILVEQRHDGACGR